MCVRLRSGASTELAPHTPLPLTRAQVDYMRDAVRDITHTPTFAIYRQGRKVRVRAPAAAASAPLLCMQHGCFLQLTSLPPSLPACLPAPRQQVDQFFGANEQQLRDHAWLFTD